MTTNKPRKALPDITPQALPKHPVDYYRTVYALVVGICRSCDVPLNKGIRRVADEYGEPVASIREAFNRGHERDPTIKRPDDPTEHRVYRHLRGLLASGRRKSDAVASTAKRFDLKPSTVSSYYGFWRGFDPEPLDLSMIRRKQERSRDAA